MSRGPCLQYFPALDKFYASLGKGSGVEGESGESLDDQWSDIVSHKWNMCCTVSRRLPWKASRTSLGEGVELKNWIFKQEGMRIVKYIIFPLEPLPSKRILPKSEWFFDEVSQKQKMILIKDVSSD